MMNWPKATHSDGSGSAWRERISATPGRLVYQPDDPHSVDIEWVDASHIARARTRSVDLIDRADTSLPRGQDHQKESSASKWSGANRSYQQERCDLHNAVEVIGLEPTTSTLRTSSAVQPRPGGMSTNALELGFRLSAVVDVFRPRSSSRVLNVSYGDTHSATPRLGPLFAEGSRYLHCPTPSPSSVSRSSRKCGTRNAKAPREVVTLEREVVAVEGDMAVVRALSTAARTDRSTATCRWSSLTKRIGTSRSRSGHSGRTSANETRFGGLLGCRRL